MRVAFAVPTCPVRPSAEIVRPVERVFPWGMVQPGKSAARKRASMQQGISLPRLPGFAYLQGKPAETRQMTDSLPVGKIRKAALSGKAESRWSLLGVAQGGGTVGPFALRTHAAVPRRESSY